jgi:hypothetical protein
MNGMNEDQTPVPAGDAATKPATEYARFDDEPSFQDAVGRLLLQKGRELRIFDPDFSGLRPNHPERVEQLRAFLQQSRTRRIYLVVHNPDFIAKQAPRFLGLYARYTHAITIQRTHETLRDLKDSFLVLDSSHYVRRASARYYRGAIGINDEAEAYAMRTRFMEIWPASFPTSLLTTLGI